MTVSPSSASSAEASAPEPSATAGNDAPRTSITHEAPTVNVSRRSALLGRWAIPLGGLAVALAITIRTHVFFMYPWVSPVSNDEGYLAGMALRMVRGHWLPYVDGVSQRGPILYWITTAVMRIGGLWSWVPMRLEGLALALLMSTLVFALSTVLFSPMAGALASMALCYFMTYELQPWDGVGVNGEPMAVCFALAAALLAARIQLRETKNRRRTIAIIGFLVACAGLTKQMFLLHGVPIGLWLLLGRPDDARGAWRERVREFGWLMLGFVAPYVVVVGIYAAAGHLKTFVYYYQQYGRDIFMDPLTRDYMRDKVREQIDRYFIGVAGVGAIYFVAVARSLQHSLRVKLAPDVTGERKALPYAPETHVLLNLVLPGFGLYRVPRRRLVGTVGLVVNIAVLAVRALIRRRLEIPYTPAGVGRDLVIWLVLGTVAGVVTALLIAVNYPDVRWRLVERIRASAVPWYAVAQMTMAFAGACFTFRFFPHYFVEFFPFAAVVIGGVTAISYEKLGIDDRPGLASAFVVVLGASFLLAIANSALYRNVRIRRETDRWYQDPATDPIVRYVQERTTRDQSIFVWGFRAETYLSAQRWPASRFVYTVYPAGVVPWFQATHEEEERRVVPGSREELLEDLDREQPELVIDAGRSMNGRYMYNYPVLRTYLDRKYCFMRYVDGEPVYRRRHGERCPPADY